MVLFSARSLSALLLTLALSAGDPALCAGWIAQPDLPMSCCADGQPCPMHASEDQTTGSAHHGPEGAPEDCCMLSGQADAVPAASAAQVVRPLEIASGADSRLQVPAPVHAGRVPAFAWPPGPHVSRHVLLSVFLV
jgi:hypothetical protein